jgi:chromate reductase, NAD(P)H dehydrogenase (quinone)
MKKVLVLPGSNSSVSINRKLAFYAASQLRGVELVKLDLNDFEMPIYSYDREKASGIPEKAQTFLKHIQNSDGILISFAEHNGNFSVAFKNVLDWVSRVSLKDFAGKPMLLMATSPGKRGGKSVLGIATTSFTTFGAKVAASLSLPLFNDNFKDGIAEPTLKTEFDAGIKAFQDLLA